MDELEEGREMDESITEELREYAAEHSYWRRGTEYVTMNDILPIADRIDARFTHELEAKQDEVDGLRSDNADLQAKLDASITLPLDADGVPCRIGDLLEAEEHIPRKAVGYYLADESTPCVTLDFVSPSIEASRLHHVAPEPPDSQERIDADVEKSACEYFGHSGKSCIGCPADGGTTTASCMRRQMSDLLRRQRELEWAGGQA